MIEHINEVPEALQFILLIFGWAGAVIGIVAFLAGASQKDPKVE